jgi:hypothetical protein
MKGASTGAKSQKISTANRATPLHAAKRDIKNGTGCCK